MRKYILCAFAVALSACAATSETPLTRNMVGLDNPAFTAGLIANLMTFPRADPGNGDCPAVKSLMTTKRIEAYSDINDAEYTDGWTFDASHSETYGLEIIDRGESNQEGPRYILSKLACGQIINAAKKEGLVK